MISIPQVNGYMLGYAAARMGKQAGLAMTAMTQGQVSSVGPGVMANKVEGMPPGKGVQPVRTATGSKAMAGAAGGKPIAGAAGAHAAPSAGVE